MENKENRNLIVQAEGIPLLVLILKRGCAHLDRSREYAAEALRELADTCDTHEAFVQAGAIPELVTMLKSNSESLKVVAAGALMGLAKNVNNKQHLSDAGAITLLADIMRNSNNIELKKCATTALKNLEQQDPSKE